MVSNISRKSLTERHNTLRFLVTGGDGRLGTGITQRLQAAHPAKQITSTDKNDLDITDYAAVQAVMQRRQPQVVFHCAAWTNVDGCAEQPDKAIAVNGYGAGNVAAAAHDVGALIVYVSTNEVFSGKNVTRPYREYDPRHPANPYGYSKFVGEQEVARLNPRHIIARTSWLFAHGGRNFIQAIIGAAEAGKSLRVVTDEIAHPTYTDDLADALIKLATVGRPGIYHLVNEGAVSRWEFARYVLDQAGHTQTPIKKITSDQWPRASTPPPNTPLASTHARQRGVQLRPWYQAVNAFLEQEGLRVNA